MDNMPDYYVEQQRIKAQRAEQLATIERQRLEIMEMGSRQNNHRNNIIAARKCLQELEIKLKGLVETHGEMSIEELEQI